MGLVYGVPTHDAEQYAAQVWRDTQTLTFLSTLNNGTQSSHFQTHGA